MRADSGLTGVAAGGAMPDTGAAGVDLLAALARERRAREGLLRAEWELEAAGAQVAACRGAMRAAAMAELLERAGRAAEVTAREAAALAEAARVAEGRLAGVAAVAAPAAAAGPKAQVVRVWDPVVRLFHWGVAGAFLANAFVTEPGKAAHLWVGYGVAALVVLRVLWGFAGTRHARFADFWPRPAAVRRQLAEMAGWQRVAHAGHSPLGALMIFNLLASLGGVAVTGHMLTTVTWFGVGWVGDLHESLVLWIEVSVALHVLAVAVESLRTGVNLAAAMVTGRKRLG